MAETTSGAEAEKLSILAFATEWDSSHGGLSTLNRNLCIALAKLGHSVYCAIPLPDQDAQIRAQRDGVTLVWPKHLTAVTPNPPQMFLTRPLDLVQSPLDVVIGHGRITGPAALAQKLDWYPQALYLHFVHMDPIEIEWPKSQGGSAKNGAVRRARQRGDAELALASHAALVAAVGPTLHQNFQAYLGERSDIVHEFLPGLSSEPKPSHAPRGTPICLMFGRMEDAHLKGLWLAADAFAKAGLRAQFHVLGCNPGDEDEVRQELENRSVRIADVRAFSSDVEAVRSAIRSASLVLMPSLAEGFGLAGIEAISEGVPVILSRESGLAVAILDRAPQAVDDALLFDSTAADAVEKLCACIKQRLEDRELARSRALSLLDAMRADFSWEKSARELVEAIRRCASASAGGQGSPPAGSFTSPLKLMLEDCLRVSEGLGAHPRDIATGWIERDEMGTLREFVLGDEKRSIVLLGVAGSGKSALLGRLAHDLRRDGRPVFAIKCDHLPASVEDIDGLTKVLGLSSRVDRFILALAELCSPVVLILDQLDVLCDLVDNAPGRLDALLKLVHCVQSHAAVRVVLSARSFEFEHDLRFKAIPNPKKLWLGSLSLEEVRRQLGENADAVLASVPAEVLVSPQSLKVFFELSQLTSDFGGIDSRLLLIDRLWRTKLNAIPGLEQVATHLAVQMAEREELSLSLLALSEGHLLTGVKKLLSTGLITQDKKDAVAFSHQTFFEHALARGFILRQTSLVAYALGKQQGLFVRKTIQATMRYLRAVERDRYLSELLEFEQRPDLRWHLRALLIDFVSGVEVPFEEEVTFLLRRLAEPDWDRYTLNACATNEAWFHILVGAGALQPFVTRGDALYGMLEFALNRGDVEASQLLMQALHRQTASAEWVGNVLSRSAAWPGEASEVAQRIVLTEATPEYLRDAILVASFKVMPEKAFAIISAYLKQLAAIDPRTLETGIEPTTHPLLAWKPYWIEDVALRQADRLLRVIWPNLVAVLDGLASERVNGRYHRDSDVHSWVGSQGLIDLISDMIPNCSFEALEGMIQNSTSQSESVHRLLMGAAVFLAKSGRHERVIEYLLSDPRILSVEAEFGTHPGCVELIKTLSSYLTSQQARELESMILTYRQDDVSRQGLSDEQRRSFGVRIWRFERLDALGPAKLSEAGRRILDEDRRWWNANYSQPRALPEGLVEIRSPMNAAQMGLATDPDIVGLFSLVVPDGTRTHPRDPLVGGSEEAAHEFAQFAESNPDRAAVLLLKFTPGVSETPVAAGLEVLGRLLPRSRIELLVGELSLLGFASEQIRVAACDALSEANPDRDPKPETLKLLRSWINPSPDPVDSAETAPQSSPTKNSILFGTWGGGRVPAGNLPALEAMIALYVRRQQPFVDEAIRTLSHHLEQQESSAVWCALARRLHLWLFSGTAQLTIEFVEKLLQTRIEVRESYLGAHLVARSMSVFEESTWWPWMEVIRSSGGPFADQAWGELLVLAASRGSARARTEVHTLLANCRDSSGPVLIGVAHAAAQLGSNKSSFSFAIEVCAELAERADSSVAAVAAGVFRSHGPRCTAPGLGRLLRALADRPDIIGRGFGLLHSTKGDGGERIGGWLEFLLPHHPREVARVISTIIDGVQFTLSLHGPELAGLAFALHRRRDTREAGLELFEELIRRNARGARTVLDASTELGKAGA